MTWTRATIFERICFAVWHSFQDIPPLHLSSKPTCRRYNLVHNVVCSSRHLVPQDVSGSYHCAPARYSRSFYLLSLKDVSLFSRVEVYIFTPARDISYRLSMPHILCSIISMVSSCICSFIGLVSPYHISNESQMWTHHVCYSSFDVHIICNMYYYILT